MRCAGRIRGADTKSQVLVQLMNLVRLLDFVLLKATMELKPMD